MLLDQKVEADLDALVESGVLDNQRVGHTHCSGTKEEWWNPDLWGLLGYS